MCKRTSRHFLSILGTASYDEYVPGVRAHACSADCELQLLRDRWSGGVLARQKRRHRDGVTIETVDFTFSPSASCKKKRPPLSWHMRMEEQAEIENAWNVLRTGEQVQKVSGYLGLLPGRIERTTPTPLRNGHFNLTTLVKRSIDSRIS
jgi:hypothetical protein